MRDSDVISPPRQRETCFSMRSDVPLFSNKQTFDVKPNCVYNCDCVFVSAYKNINDLGQCIH